MSALEKSTWRKTAGQQDKPERPLFGLVSYGRLTDQVEPVHGNLAPVDHAVAGSGVAVYVTVDASHLAIGPLDHPAGRDLGAIARGRVLKAEPLPF